ncbi:type III PLP-dependent enzyme [Neptuniibacter sp. CAU 1671]|uniref:type III PLP-dependent enzyme n=1 Tax=Neptuniibacter sp. CAU 1671 TaxID=3032593 RepID=UPI0023DC682E|nr:type III PLP-dependent enzyme [Neptuniibacter sp. CAU 1671]MDF2180918.1 type III PLP-dependent enzyme [Neptuniibacter sp. CAU 1671]
MKLPDYFSPDAVQRIAELAETHETPFLALDLSVVEGKYQELNAGFPHAEIFYAVKANPANEVIERLAALGSNFDIASPQELDKVLKFGVSPDRISYGNTIKKRSAIQYFYERGVRLFATDSEADLQNIAKYAPGSDVYVRVLTDGSEGADWPLSRKFGCNPEMAVELHVMARDLGLNPYGVSFHVGSQQRDIDVWDGAIAKVKVIFDRLNSEHDIRLKMVNMGGGFPANYLQKTNEFSVYAQEISRFLQEDFTEEVPRIILEPGRSLVGDAGVIVSEVVLISRKSSTALERWVYTDIGMFNGLIETVGESIKYPIGTSRSGEEEEVILAGPTCDSMDIMYENHMYPLPLSLEIGDHIYWYSTGAYTTSYSSIEFNGFPPLKYYVL